MQKVVVLTPTEYEDLKGSHDSLLKMLEELERLKDKPTELKEYIEKILD